MLLRFTKMHGLGNDFVVIDAVSQNIQVSQALVKKLADRHFGIGCDQLLVVEPPTSEDVDFRYRIFNQDGNEVEQCGNGARCFAKFVRDRRLTGKSLIRVETNAGIIELKVHKDHSVEVNMGAPIFEPANIPFKATEQQTLYPFEVGADTYQLSCLSMGNPHGVLVVDKTDSAPVNELGPKLENHPLFPQQANIGFMEIINREEINLRVFERGVGETLACGTGACAAVVAGIQQNLLNSIIKVNLLGGSLVISWQGEGENVIMTGPATTVFHGRIRI